MASDTVQCLVEEGAKSSVAEHHCHTSRVAITFIGEVKVFSCGGGDGSHTEKQKVGLIHRQNSLPCDMLKAVPTLLPACPTTCKQALHCLIFVDTYRLKVVCIVNFFGHKTVHVRWELVLWKAEDNFTKYIVKTAEMTNAWTSTSEKKEP